MKNTKFLHLNFNEDALNLRTFCQKFFNVILNMNCLEVSAVSHVWFAIRSHKKLFKIPRNVIPLHWRPSNELGVGHQRDGVITGSRKAFLQKIKHRMGFFTVDRNFLHYWEAGSEAIPWTNMTERLDDFSSIGIFLIKRKKLTNVST